jgi:hypothetical protein
MMNLVKAVLPAIEGWGEPERSAIIEEFKRLGVYCASSGPGRQGLHSRHAHRRFAGG